MWTDVTEDSTTWTEQAADTADLVAGSPIGLLLTLTHTYSQTVFTTLWTDTNDSTTVWA